MFLLPSEHTPALHQPTVEDRAPASGRGAGPATGEFARLLTDLLNDPPAADRFGAADPRPAAEARAEAPFGGESAGRTAGPQSGSAREAGEAAGVGPPTAEPRDALEESDPDPVSVLRETLARLLKTISSGESLDSPQARQDLKKLQVLVEKAGGQGRVASVRGAAGSDTLALPDQGLLGTLRGLLSAFLRGDFSGAAEDGPRVRELRDLLKGLLERLPGLEPAGLAGVQGAAAGSRGVTAAAALLSAAAADRPASVAPGRTEGRVRSEDPSPRLVVVDLRKASPARTAAAVRGRSAAEDGQSGTNGNGKPAGEGEARAAAPRIGEPRFFFGEAGFLERGGGERTDAAPRGQSYRASGADLRERLFPEMVRHTGIILRDGGKGEIRLMLKPESLGNIRVRIQVQDSSVEARIIVDNKSIKELIEGNLDGLRSALQDEGFQPAALSVTVGGEDSGREDRGKDRRVGRPDLAAREMEKSVPLMDDWTRVDLLVDLVV